MKVRAKFQVTKVAEFGYDGKRQEVSRIKKHVPANTADPDDGSVTRSNRTDFESTGVPVREITMSAVCDGSEENKSFATSTPTGSITFVLNNPALEDEFKPGQAYYLDFTPAGN